MMTLWPSGLMAKEIFSPFFFPIQSLGPSALPCVSVGPPHMTVPIQLPWKWIHIQGLRASREQCWERERREDKEIHIYPVISFIWSRFENNSPVHLSLSDHIIRKWSLQNINSISITGACGKTHWELNWPYHNIWGAPGGFQIFSVRGNQNQSGSC